MPTDNSAPTTSTTQVFEYRLPGQGNLHKKKWMLILPWVVVTGVVFGMPFVGINWGGFDLVTVSLIYMLMCMSLWTRYYATKYCSLTLTEDALVYIFRLPFGLSTLFPMDWRICLRDITKVEVNQSPLMGTAPIPGMEQLCISQREGPMRYIAPANWFAPDAVAPPPVKPTGKPRLFASPSTIWKQPENQLIARSAFADLPIVLALRARGIEVPNTVLLPDAKEFDLFASRSVKFGIVAGLGLFVAALVIMILNKHQHLQIDFPLWVYLALVGASLLAMWAIVRRDAWRPPVFNIVLASIFLIAGVALSAQPVATLFNGLGVGTDQSQVFKVHAGSLEPIEGKTGIGSIYLLAPQTRETWLKEGSAITLYVKKGRLGLWEYDDVPLRLLADE